MTKSPSDRASNASIRGWGLFVIGAVLFFAGIATDSLLLPIGFWAVVIGLGFLVYGRLTRKG